MRKETELDIEAALSEAIFGHGFLHYGLWPAGIPEQATAVAVGQAQQAWFDRLAAEIPAGVETILDVGSGTGANALALTKLGYRVECLCPSEDLNAMARRKLDGQAQVHTVGFEDFDVPRRFDLCFFGESFHYIQLAPALRQLDRYATKHVIIFDYFRRVDTDTTDRRGTHAEFLQRVAAHSAFRVAHDEDVTEAIAPTFHVLNAIKEKHLVPMAQNLRAEFRRTKPVLSMIAEFLLARRIDRALRPSNRAATFSQTSEYRLIRLERN
jgi:SAM-dependent methyltransferase